MPFPVSDQKYLSDFTGIAAGLFHQAVLGCLRRSTLGLTGCRTRRSARPATEKRQREQKYGYGSIRRQVDLVMQGQLW